MKNFRGMVRLNDVNYLEFFDDSFWWGNRGFFIGDDPNLERYMEANKIDKDQLIPGNVNRLDNDGSYIMGFEKGSKGFSGFFVKGYSKEKFISPIIGFAKNFSPLEVLEIKKFGSKEKYLLGSSEHWDFYVDRNIHDYFTETLSSNEFGRNERDDISYFKNNKLVGIISPFKFNFR